MIITITIQDVEMDISLVAFVSHGGLVKFLFSVTWSCRSWTFWPFNNNNKKKILMPLPTC